MPFNQIWKIVFLAIGGMLCLNQLIYKPSPRSKTYPISTWILAVLSALSCWGYFEFGDLHEYGAYGKHYYHYHEIYHYYVGAKYYPELGNTRLYDCTYAAFDELSREGVRIPRIRTIRSLETAGVSHPVAWVLENKKPDCLARFAPERWSAFKKDLKVFLDHGWYNGWWETALFDLGFNPPPSWNLFGSTLARIIPLTPLTMELMPWIDIVLVFGLAGFLIFRAFGLYPLFGYLLFFGNNWLSSYLWTGGSFFRQVWFFLLVAGVCMMRKERYRLAGMAMGVSAALRIFPMFFALGAALPLFWAALKHRKDRAPLLSYVSSLLVSFGALVLFSLIVYGTQHWIEFWTKITEHNHTYYVMHLGYEKFAVFQPSIGNQNFWYDEGLIRFTQWQDRLHLIYREHLVLHTVVKLAALALAISAAALATPAAAMLIFGSCLFYFFSIPANYYYVYLALWPVVLLSEPLKQLAWLRLALVFLVAILIPIMPVISADHIVHNGFINIIMVSFLILIYLSYNLGFYLNRGTAPLHKAKSR